jgi:hypothetical protein
MPVPVHHEMRAVLQDGVARRSLPRKAQIVWRSPSSVVVVGA